MSQTPKPDNCPFCGAIARLDGDTDFAVSCTKCPASMGCDESHGAFGNLFDTQEEACTAWNNRAGGMSQRITDMAIGYLVLTGEVKLAENYQKQLEAMIKQVRAEGYHLNGFGVG